MHNNVKKQLTKSPFNEQKDLLAQRYAVDPLSRKIRIRKSYHPTSYYLDLPTSLPTVSELYTRTNNHTSYQHQVI